METIKIAVNSFDTQVGSAFQRYIQGPTLVRGVVHLLLILYAARLAPVPPKQVLVLFENVYFKLFIFSLVLWSAQFSPSTSILIALAFMVTINYTTKGQLWEMLDNVSQQTVTSEQSVEAVQMLSQAAASPVASDGQIVAQIANVAGANVTSQEGAEAVKLLAQQAVVPEAGVPEKVVAAATQAMDSMTKQAQTFTPQQSVEAVQVLSQAASSPAASDSQVVSQIATVAAANVTTQQGVEAVQALAQQAVVPEAGIPEKVAAAATQAMDSMAKPTETSGCYPMRSYDMSKVSPQIDGVMTVEDYATWDQKMM